MKKQLFKKKYLPVPLFLVIVVSIFSGCRDIESFLSVANFPVNYSSPENNRNITSSTMNFVEIWRVKTGTPNIAPYPMPTTNPPFIIDDTVIMSYFIDTNKSADTILTAFSIDTGKVLWQTKLRAD